ncbi:MAG TPA: hypothetical protein VMG41_12975 [Gemmatimonadales bacterium]|nr:hypothetical protein [Gemmatimonadales bacterium]
MTWRSSLCGPLSLGVLLLACATNDSLGSWGGSAGGGGGGARPALEPMEFNASVNTTLPAGYSISDEQPYQWQAYIRYGDAWVPVGSSQTSDGPAADLVIDCNASQMHSACTLHLSGMIQVTVTRVSPGPARLCAYKSGFLWHDDLLLNTPLGDMSLAPVASSSQDPANEGICYP